MNESILVELRKLFGGSVAPDDFTHFDTDIMIHANTYFANLVQMGVGSPGFLLTNENQTWEDFLGEEYPADRLAQVKTYVFIKIKLVFDPPQSSFYATNLKEEARELEWRINVEVDPGMNRLDGDES